MSIDNSVCNKENTKILDKLQFQVDVQDDKLRYNNIRIEGIADQKDNIEQIQHKISRMFYDKLEMKDVKIEKINRLQNAANSVPSNTVVVKLQSSFDRDQIIRRSYKLKNTGVFINDDVSEGTMRIRKDKLEHLKEAKRKGKIAYFIGRKLIIHERRNPHQAERTSLTPPRQHQRQSSVTGLIENWNDRTPGINRSETTQPTDTSDSTTGSQRSRLRPSSNVFIWWCTMFGYLGVGPLRDFYRLPTYVKEYNEEDAYIKSLSDDRRIHTKPPFNLVRFVGQILVGNSWIFLLNSAIPKEEIYGMSFEFITYLSPFVSAIAVWLIGNIGRHQGEFKWAFYGTLVCLPFTIASPKLNNWTSVVSAILFNYKGKSWRKNARRKKSFLKRMFILTTCFMVFTTFWCSYLYFNATVVDKHNNRIKLREAIKNFWNSPVAQEFQKNIRLVYDEFWKNGYNGAKDKLLEVFDPAGEHYALKVLGLNKSASLQEISSTYKTLVKKWHPDKNSGKSAEEKEEINQNFIKIQKAYETLKSIKKSSH